MTRHIANQVDFYCFIFLRFYFISFIPFCQKIGTYYVKNENKINVKGKNFNHNEIKRNIRIYLPRLNPIPSKSVNIKTLYMYDILKYVCT